MNNREEMERIYLASPEVAEKTALTRSLFSELDNSNRYVQIDIQLPAGYRELLHFLERKRVASSVGRRRSLKQVLEQIIANECEEILGQLAHDEIASFSYYEDVWNRICDESGYPELKRQHQTATEAEDLSDGLPF